MDLIFPHHEAEIAQMEAASGKKPLVSVVDFRCSVFSVDVDGRRTI